MIGLLAGLALLCILIVVHEFGHFLFAKLMGVRVLTFSVGFGPKIFGVQRGDTHYQVCAIPLGGFVRMFGDNIEEEVPEELKKFGFLYQPVWKKSLIACAGPLFNLLLPLVLLFFVFIGREQVLEPIVGTVMPHSAADRAGLLPQDKIIALNKIPIESFSDLVTAISPHAGESVTLEIERKKQRLSLNITPQAEKDPNPLKAHSNVGRIGISPAIQIAKVAVSVSTGVAAQAGIKTSDEITHVNEKEVGSSAELFRLLHDNQAGDVTVRVKGRENSINLPKSTAPVSILVDSSIDRYNLLTEDFASEDIQARIGANKAILAEFERELEVNRGLAPMDGVVETVKPDSAASILGVKPGDQLLAIDGTRVTPFLNFDDSLGMGADKAYVLGIMSNGQFRNLVFRPKVDNKKFLGVHFAEGFKPGSIIERNVGVAEAAKRSFERTGELISLTVGSLAMLVKREVPVSDLGGPIMIFGVAGQAVAQGLAYYIYVMCLISVNLGLLNLLPIPVLDGGHLMMFAIEGIQRKPISIRTRQIATRIGLAILLALMAVAIFNDLSRLIK